VLPRSPQVQFIPHRKQFISTTKTVSANYRQYVITLYTLQAHTSWLKRVVLAGPANTSFKNFVYFLKLYQLPGLPVNEQGISPGIPQVLEKTSMAVPRYTEHLRILHYHIQFSIRTVGLSWSSSVPQHTRWRSSPTRPRSLPSTFLLVHYQSPFHSASCNISYRQRR